MRISQVKSIEMVYK